VAALRALRKHRGLQLNVSFSDARIGSCHLFLLKNSCVCRVVSATRIQEDGHLKPDELILLLATVSGALEQMGPKL